MAFKSGPVITFKYHGKHKETTNFFFFVLFFVFFFGGGGGGVGGGLYVLAVLTWMQCFGNYNQGQK